MTSQPDNWMPLYIGSYMKKTTRLTREQHGTYLLLIMDSWINGAPPDDDAVLASIVKASPPEWRRLRPVIAPFFQIEDGKWCHDKIERERDRAADIIDKKRAAGAAGGAAARGKSGRKKNSGKIAGAISEQIAEPIANECQKNTPLPSHSPDGEVSSLRSDTSAAASPPAPVLGPVFIALPTNRFEIQGEEFPVYEPFVEEMQGLYPAIDVRAQLRAMRAWLITHDRQRKTKSGMKRFINGWLSRSQNSAPSRETIQGNGNGHGKRQSANDKFLAAAAAVVGDFLGSPEGGDDSGPANEIGRPLLSA